MRRLGAISTILATLSLAAAMPALAQGPRATTPERETAAASRGNVSAVGRKMPPASGRPPASAAVAPKPADAKAPDPLASARKATTEADMVKAQKAAEERNKAWDGKMRKTMGSICHGC